MSVAGDSVLDFEDISPGGLVRPAKPATKTVYFNEWQGDDKNDGLASERAVYSRKRGLEVARRKRTQSFDIRGNAPYIEKITQGKMSVKE